MSNSQIHQASAFTPALCSHNGLLHAIFIAANDSHDLLHIVSVDGISWERKNNVRQAARFAPAVADFNDTLRIVFVANNASNDLLTCTYDDALDIWTDNSPLGESSKTGPAVGVVSTVSSSGALTQHLLMYFVADNDSNELLVTEIDSFNPPLFKKGGKGHVPIHLPDPSDTLKDTPPPVLHK
ncbi:MAG TPA: hypothetical protein VNU92_10360 [Edaphobacter sp.]|jgi:hypothetical protein|nr:hypothetical protein [Edaphobacter sp.]